MEKERHNFDIRGMKGIVVLNFHLLGHVINSVVTLDKHWNIKIIILIFQCLSNVANIGISK